MSSFIPAKEKCPGARRAKVRIAEAYSLYVAAKRTDPNAADGCLSFAGIGDALALEDRVKNAGDGMPHRHLPHLLPCRIDLHDSP